jgi:transcriptional regulator with XRE-family HTH domain
MKKTPNPVDQHVGARLKARRVTIGLSQEKLGDSLEISFQQVQKYEKGTNRIGASRLQLAAKVLGVPVNYFFDGSPAQSAYAAGFAESPTLPFLPPTAPGPDETALLEAFARVKDTQLRLRIIGLVEAMSTKEIR